MEKRFKVSYRGEAEYAISGHPDLLVAIRDFAYDDGYYNVGVFDHDIKPRIGCVYYSRTYDLVYQFVPDDIAALFPGYVRCRWKNEEGLPIEYDGNPPELIESKLGWTTKPILKAYDLEEFIP